MKHDNLCKLDIFLLFESTLHKSPFSPLEIDIWLMVQRSTLNAVSSSKTHFSVFLSVFSVVKLILSAALRQLVVTKLFCLLLVSRLWKLIFLCAGEERKAETYEMFWYLLTRCAVATRKERISRWDSPDYRFSCNIFLSLSLVHCCLGCFWTFGCRWRTTLHRRTLLTQKVGNRLFINSSSRTSILTDRRKKKIGEEL